MTPAAPAVRMVGIRKQFGEAVALAGVDFDVRAGEVHALLGENGAGKSTLMHVLSGGTLADSGRIEVAGTPLRFRSPRDAARAGVGMVHQHFTLVGNFTVRENLALALPARSPFLPSRGLAAEPLALAERLGWSLDPETPAWQLPVGVQQRLEIVKVLARDPQVLILDEPTAVLAPVELEELFAVIDRLRKEGRAIVFISHKLNEVLRLSDRVTVLRRGRNAGTVLRSDTDAADLARRMVGVEEADSRAAAPAFDANSPTGMRELPPGDFAGDARDAGPGDVVLRLVEARARDDRGLEGLCGVSLEVRAGEILGVAGVDGNGQAELAEVVLGLRPLSGGGLDFPGAAAADGMPPRRRIGYIPQDRKRAGLVPEMSVRDNLILELHQDPEAQRGPWLRWDWLTHEAEMMVEEHDIRASGLEQDAATLSGGNQQKIVIARALRKAPRLVVAVNPTRGVDVGATAYVHSRLRMERQRGAGVLLISTELDEVLALSDRVGVLYGGKLTGPVSPETPRERLGLMMGGRVENDAHPP